MRMTKNRKIVLELLKKHNKPMSAELIYNELGEDTMDLSTIYRSLDVLYNNNYLLKSTLMQTTYYHLNNEKHNHYMLCLECNNLFTVDCHLHNVKKDIELKNDLKIISHNLIFYGYCSKCKNL